MLLAARYAMLTGRRGGRFVAFTSPSAFSVAMAHGADAPEVALVSSLDDGPWSPFVPGGAAVPCPAGSVLRVKAARGGNFRFATASSDAKANRFVLTGSVSVSGDITALLDADAPVADLSGRQYCFSRLFCDNTGSLVSAAGLVLPSMALAPSCYDCLFMSCQYLVDPPAALPAATAASLCYWRMFSACYRLARAPRIDATSLAGGCFGYMFSDCIRMETPPELLATTLVGSCYTHMFYNCRALSRLQTRQTSFDAGNGTESWLYNVAASGTLYCDTAALGTDETIERGVSACPEGWNVQNFFTEVEYLESTGTQWIDTGVHQRYGLACTLTYRKTGSTESWGTYFGCGSADDPKWNILGRHYSSEGASFNPWYANDEYGECRVPVSTTEMNTVTVRGGACEKDGASYAITTVAGRIGTQYSIYLFSANNANLAWRSQPCRIAAFSIADEDASGELVRDLIPVRFTNENGVSEGAMYDRVTKQLFRNQGTGAFVIGPDKTN